MLWIWIDCHTVRFILQPYAVGATPPFSYNSVLVVPAGQRNPLTVRCAGTLQFSITPHLISCFFKSAPVVQGSNLHLLREGILSIRPTTSLIALASGALMKKQPFGYFFSNNVKQHILSILVIAKKSTTKKAGFWPRLSNPFMRGNLDESSSHGFVASCNQGT